MAPQKGKQGTKGAKQIVDENAATLAFYRYMIFGSVGIYIILKTVRGQGYDYWDIACFLFAAGVMSASIQFMRFMAKPKYSEINQLLDSGTDLNMESGVAEQAKDVIILTCMCQVLSFFSSYVWCLWLLVPVKGLYYAWVNFIGPWVFAPAPEQSATEEKKGRKMERRMRR